METNSLEAIKEEAIKQYPNETCGVIVKKGKKPLVIACRNMSAEPRVTFIMSTEDYSKAADQGEIVGIWHTHTETSPAPSDADKVGCNSSELPWYIMSTHKNGDAFYFSDPVEIIPDDFKMPYLERPYCAGVFDCYTIVKDFYEREFSIKLGSYPYIREDGRMGYTFFAERYPDEGFERLNNAEPKRGDVFILQMNANGPSHLAVHLGDGQILHHSIARLSRREIYGGYWLKHTVYHLRHKELKC